MRPVSPGLDSFTDQLSQLHMTDYERVAKAIEYLTSRVEHQPMLEEIAAHIHLSPYHFQRLFSRWAGVTPKRFLQILTVERAKELLLDAKPLLDVSGALGLSSGSRLYDHFVNLEAITPGEYKTRGIGLAIEYAVHATPFGDAFIAITRRGICKLSFLGSNGADQEILDLVKQWPHAELLNTSKHTTAVVERAFNLKRVADRPLSLLVSGTNFQVSVWKALLKIPPGTVASYSQVAAAIGRPSAARAVGLAVGSNPVALLIPCHRVIQQSGKLGGYHWGETRKHAIHAWEAARCE
jgi:AraC family transcriptional regulator, regulatory protein of adaptative response / methylated-DNA-[protein]-cysteine methyltransferase